MFSIWTIRRVVSWIGCFAILVTSLAPAISHALIRHDTTRLLTTEICTVEGKQWQVIELAVARKSSPAPHAQHFEDCPFCPIQGDTGILPPETGATLFAVSASHHLPLLFYQSPRPLFVWATPQSRSPPVQS